MSVKITELSDYNNNTLSISPEQAIQKFRQYLKDNPRFDKVLLLALDNKGSEFEPIWFKGMMLNSEALAALDIAKSYLRQTIKGETD